MLKYIFFKRFKKKIMNITSNKSMEKYSLHF